MSVSVRLELEDVEGGFLAPFLFKCLYMHILILSCILIFLIIYIYEIYA